MLRLSSETKCVFQNIQILPHRRFCKSISFVVKKQPIHNTQWGSQAKPGKLFTKSGENRILRKHIRKKKYLPLNPLSTRLARSFWRFQVETH